MDNWIADLKPTQIKIWEPLRRHYPDFSIEKLPSKLKDVKDIEIGEFINQIKSLETNTLEIDDHIPIWPYVCIGIGVICLVIAFGLFCYCKCYPKFQNYQKVRRERTFGSYNVNKLKVQMLKPSAPRDSYIKRKQRHQTRIIRLQADISNTRLSNDHRVMAHRRDDV